MSKKWPEFLFLPKVCRKRHISLRPKGAFLQKHLERAVNTRIFINIAVKGYV